MEPSSHLAQKFFHLSMHCLPYSGTNSRHTHHTPTNPKMAYGRHLTRLKLIHSKLNYIGACPYALQVQDPNFISFVVFLLLLETNVVLSHQVESKPQHSLKRSYGGYLKPRRDSMLEVPTFHSPPNDQASHSNQHNQ